MGHPFSNPLFAPAQIPSPLPPFFGSCKCTFSTLSVFSCTFSTLTVESFHDDDRHFRPFTLVLFHANNRPHTYAIRTAFASRPERFLVIRSWRPSLGSVLDVRHRSALNGP